MTRGESVPTNREFVELKYCEDKTGPPQPLNRAMSYGGEVPAVSKLRKGCQKFIAPQERR
jgi:hypothetical protein